MQVISLFSGIGGFELATEWMGWKNIVSCEINPFGAQVLKYYWPDSYHHDDIYTLTFKKIQKRAKYNENEATILVGGFPCQPFSVAGQRKGTEDNRNLWPEMLRLIKESQPDWVVGENVHGIIDWGGGMVFEQIQIDLEDQGYEVQTYVLPAISKDAPHNRERLFIVAHTNNPGLERGKEKGNIKRERKKPHEQFTGRIRPDWKNFPTQSPICNRNDGISAGLVGITFPKWRIESIKAMGNAVVPQVIYEIFKAIDRYELIYK